LALRAGAALGLVAIRRPRNLRRVSSSAVFKMQGGLFWFAFKKLRSARSSCVKQIAEVLINLKGMS
jgi:hypothetical protein